MILRFSFLFFLVRANLGIFLIPHFLFSIPYPIFLSPVPIQVFGPLYNKIVGFKVPQSDQGTKILQRYYHITMRYDHI